ncbi:D-hydantoinase [Hyaloscypha bicolor E]|uniref:D-hydantoinase n=1 Tax=Hyaloscypha bicolor E TaxID=1095630 RepID=A0A2J6SMS4_9HELO|nr:D-hydantoinase [Hyaloscypha bicolor E]PMD52076.1 D-hydantoinase [Hyaloscypha bicolor E]
MAEYDLLVLNGLVVTHDKTAELDIAVKDGKIAKLLPRGELEGVEADKVIDAQEGMVMPGGVDAHVHLDEPALFGKGETADNYETGTRSAIAGGTTTLITFAPQRKTEPSLLDALATTHARAKGNCYSDYSFHLICSNAGPQAISEFSALREAGISSLKIYMTYEALQLKDSEILDVLFEARKQRIVTMIHAENGAIIDWTIKKLEEKKLFAPKYHVTSHPPVAEIEATYRAISLSGFIDVPILIVHVSSPAAAKHISDAQKKGLPVKDLEKPGFEGAKCVCSPPPREGEQDHEGIWQGLEDGTFTVLSSDHCPFLYGNTETGKKLVISSEYPNGHFKYIPNGCPGVETRLSLALSANRLQLQKFVEVTSTNAAKLYGLYPRKGALIPGESDADLTIWYPVEMKKFVLTNSMLHHNVDYTPYEGRTMKQWPRYTILRGEVVWAKDEGGLVGKKGYGEFLKRGVSSLAGSRSAEEWDVRNF